MKRSNNDRAHFILHTGYVLWPLASYQIRKIAGCAFARNAGNVFSVAVRKRSRHESRRVCEARAVMHAEIVNWQFPLTSVAGNTFPAFPVHAQTAIVRIWWEAHGKIYVGLFLEMKEARVWIEYSNASSSTSILTASMTSDGSFGRLFSRTFNH